MFLFGREKSVQKKAAFAGLVLFCLAGLLLASCDNPAGNSTGGPAFVVPGELRGTWLGGSWPDSEWGPAGQEAFTITSTAFTSLSIHDEADGGNATTYAGRIVNVRWDSDSSTAGFITIQYTANTWTPEAVNNFYVLRFEDLNSSAYPPSMRLAGAADGTGRPTRSAAERDFTGNLGTPNFQFYSTITRQ